jgi:tetratricopeptide (TPR) repeat protein
LAAGQRHWAEQAFLAVLQRAPEHTGAMASLAHLMAQDGRLEPALLWQKGVAELQPNHASAWFNLGYLLERSQQPQQAEPAFRKALGINPRLDQAWYALGLVLFQQSKHTEALLAFQENTRLQPFNSHGWTMQAQLHHRLNMQVELDRTLTHLRGFDPKAAMALERSLLGGCVGATH